MSQAQVGLDGLLRVLATRVLWAVLGRADAVGPAAGQGLHAREKVWEQPAWEQQREGSCPKGMCHL